MNVRMLLMFFIFIAAGSQALTRSDPLVLVKATADQVTSRLVDDKLLIDSQSHYLEQLINETLIPVVDYHYMSRKALGDYWKRTSATQKEEFQAAFKRKVIRTYTNAFRAFKGQPIQFTQTNTSSDTDRVNIKSQTTDASGNPIQLNYSLYFHDSHWQIYDVLINGTSLVKTFRDQIQSLIKEYGLSRAISKLSREYPDNRPIVTLGISNWAPYASEQLPDQGLAVAIVKEAITSLGYKVNIVFAPWKKLLEQADNGKLDGILATWPDLLPTSYALTASYLESELRFIKRIDDPFTYQNPTQLSQLLKKSSYKLGVFSDYDYQKHIGNLDEQFNIHRLDYCSQLFREVANRSIDLALVDRWVADNELASKEHIAEHLTVVPASIAKTTIHLAMHRKKQTPETAAFIGGFNHILKRMRSSGHYQDLLDRHQFPK